MAGYRRGERRGSLLSHEEAALQILRIGSEGAGSRSAEDVSGGKALLPEGSYAEGILESLQGSFAPLFRRVHESFWNNGVYAGVRRPYYHVDWDQGLAEYYVPTVLDGENRMHYYRVVVSVYPYLDRGTVRVEAGRLKRPFTSPAGVVDSESIFMVAPRVGGIYAEVRGREVRYADKKATLKYLRDKGLIEISDEEMEEAAWKAAFEGRTLFPGGEWREMMGRLSRDEREELNRIRRRARRDEHRRWIIRGFSHSSRKGYRTFIIIQESFRMAVKRITEIIYNFWKKRVIGMLRKLEVQPHQYDYNWRNILRDHWNTAVKTWKPRRTEMNLPDEERMMITSNNNIISRGCSPISPALLHVLKGLIATFLWFRSRLEKVMDEIGQIGTAKSAIQTFSEEIRPKLASLSPRMRRLTAEKLIIMIEDLLHEQRDEASKRNG